MLKQTGTILIFLLMANIVFPNESRTVLGSSIEVLDNENTNIIMLEEVINITLYKEYYEVTVEFDFYNEGAQEVILLGFPIKATYQPIADERELAKLYNFESYINGILLPEYTVREESTEDRFYITTTTWFLREVVFPANSHTYSRVTYRAPYNHAGFFKSAGYIYGTGRSWKGNIGRMTIFVNHEDDIIIDGVSFRNGHSPNFTWVGNGKYQYVMENFNPELDSSIHIGITPFDIYGQYRHEFGDWAEGWIWNEHLLYRNENDIRLFTKNQIRLFINFFYALHGYNFRNELYIDYFRKINDTINPNFSENDFNEIERKNIDWLLNLERMIP